MSRAARSQPDLFTPPQPDLFAGEPEPLREPKTYLPSRAWVRAYIRTVMEQAQAAETMPWDDRKVGFYRKVIPQMVNWLPPDEAERRVQEFEAELARLEQPDAA